MGQSIYAGKEIVSGAFECRTREYSLLLSFKLNQSGNTQEPLDLSTRNKFYSFFPDKFYLCVWSFYNTFSLLKYDQFRKINSVKMHFYIFLIVNSFARSVSPLIAMGWPCYMVRMWMILKVDFRSKLKKSTNSSCFIVTKYLGNNAHVEYVDNWTWSYSLVSIYA